MKILLDTSFIRHLSLVNQLSLLDDVAKKLGWQFIIPQKVRDELAKKTIPRQLIGLLDGNPIKIECCTEQEMSLMPSVILSLDEGELEAICIINKCEDRGFRDYILLTDDGPAQIKAGNMGINSLDIIAFLLSANKTNLLNKGLAISSLEILTNGEYEIEKSVYEDYINNLI